VSAHSKIEWLDGGPTWNPVRARNRETGKIGWFCEKVSPLCAHCYAEKRNLNTFFGNGIRYAADQRSKVEIFLDEKTLAQPLHWRKPVKCFPCSMTDLYAAFVPDEWITRIYDVMEQAAHITLIVLTKRPERRREFLTKRYAGRQPAPNIWELVSAGTQSEADRLIPELLQTPAAVRGISAEPLLGPIAISQWLTACVREPLEDGTFLHSDGLEWVIVGGEGGPDARPMDPDWARSLRDQCQAAGVPFFFKQWGEWAPVTKLDYAAGQRADLGFARLGKKRSGRLLDGREWNEFPIEDSQ